MRRSALEQTANFAARAVATVKDRRHCCEHPVKLARAGALFTRSGAR
jgi:hypothetical protein